MFLISVVIPIRNEEAILWQSITAIAPVFEKLFGIQNWKFILVDNCSTDSTPVILKRICEAWPLTSIVFEREPNYGAALRAGLSAVDTPFAHVIDLEQWDIPFIVWAWKNRCNHDLFIGSKRADPTICHQPPYRFFLSWGLNSILHLFFGFTGTETHGPKLINMETVGPLIDICVSQRGQYDTEFVLRSIRSGCSVVEVPIAHKEIRPPRNLMFKKVFFNIVGMYRLYILLQTVPFSGAMRLRRICREDILPSYREFERECIAQPVSSDLAASTGETT